MANKFLGFLGDLVKPATGGGNYVYYTKPSDLSWSSFVRFSSVAKVQREDYIEFIPALKLRLTNVDSDAIIALGFDMSLRVSDEETGELNTIKNILNTGEASSEDLVYLTQITEEEFYDTNLDTISHSIVIV